MNYEELLKRGPYELGAEEKKKIYADMLSELTDSHRNRCLIYDWCCSALGDVSGSQRREEEIPMVPVSMFKEMELRSVPTGAVFKTVTSSGTTGQKTSKIVLDERTAAWQQQTLQRIMADFIGEKRIPMLIIDAPNVLRDRALFSARGAGILGFSIFGSKRCYALKEDMSLDLETVEAFLEKAGDPVCRDEDFPALLAEFKEFCQNSAHNIFFLGLTDYYLREYEKQGFGLVKSGEEARFKLADYEISGKKGAKMRMNINHATKAGVTVHEYKVLEKRDPALDREFDRITDEWLDGKKSGMLQFTMGTVGLEDPMDKRYFYALNSDGKMVAFIVFVPFLGKNGYMADVTRHGKDAPSGVMETIIYEAFQVFKEEGIGYGSLGVAPLAGLSAESKNPMERLLQFIYDHLNACYGFRDLYRAKEKYSPTEWVPSYYAYLPKYPTPGMLYAAVEIQNPHGIRGYILTLLKGELHKWKK